ncbi:MAG: DUF3769 domain-containing protein [Prochlorococcus marinus XMU1428]|nr:DUF3769 domain-containing protein [Prochlorococcus marinus XMU1428]
MNTVISKKLLFFSFLFINLFQPVQSTDLPVVNKKKDHYQFDKEKHSKTFDYDKFSYLSLYNELKKINLEKKSLEENAESLLVNLSEKKEELIIESEKQSEINNVIYAEGNVSVSYKGKLLRADNLIYDKLNKKINAKGNISFLLGDQFFQVSELEYSFINEKGYLLDVKGAFNTNTLMNDLSSDFISSDSYKIESLLKLNKKEVINTPSKVENWLFFTEKMIIDGNKWASKKAIFTNDLLELKQVKLAVNSLEIISEGEELLRFRSSLSYLIFDEKVSIPLWFGDRTLNQSEESFNVENKWILGYENLDKDGYFIGRKFNSVDLTKNFVLDLEPQFLIQRSLKGYTKSFVNEGDSITSEKVKRNASFKDYFALKSEINGPINNWDLEIENNLNSFDVEKFSDAFRSKTNLSKEINFLNSKWVKNFYGVYRDRVWNGSLGEAEIYLGYGSELKKENSWVVNGIKKTEFLSLGLANIKAEGLNTKSLVTKFKGNLFYSLGQKFPINIVEPQKKTIDISYRYIPEPITKGLSINTRLEASYSFYENGDHQEYIGLGLGPEFIFGDFKNKFFDYTRLSLFPFYKLSSGESVFKFDQNYDNFTLNIALDQQLFGPVILKSSGTLNLSDDSDDYGEFIDSKIALNWKKRSYEFGIFYQPHNQAGGISFGLFGFK